MLKITSKHARMLIASHTKTRDPQSEQKEALRVSLDTVQQLIADKLVGIVSRQVGGPLSINRFREIVQRTDFYQKMVATQEPDVRDTMLRHAWEAYQSSMQDVPTEEPTI